MPNDETMPNDDTTDAVTDSTGMTREEKRHDQLTTAPEATEQDAAPRIEVTEHDGVTRIDIAPDAAVRPGPGPGAPGGDGSVDDAGGSDDAG